jgi:hypothetical protein
LQFHPARTAISVVVSVQLPLRASRGVVDHSETGFLGLCGGPQVNQLFTCYHGTTELGLLDVNLSFARKPKMLHKISRDLQYLKIKQDTRCVRGRGKELSSSRNLHLNHLTTMVLQK